MQETTNQQQCADLLRACFVQQQERESVRNHAWTTGFQATREGLGRYHCPTSNKLDKLEKQQRL